MQSAAISARPRSTNPFAKKRVPRTIAEGITLLGSERVSFFAVEEGRSITLIDCGFFGHLRYLEDWLNATARRMSDIEAVVITHGHADHLGFASVLGGRGVPVLVPNGDLAFAKTTDVRMPPVRLRRRLYRPSCLALVLEAAFDSVFTQPPVETAVGYAPGAVLDVPGRLRTVAVPGHSPGNACIYHPGVDALFTGDSLMTRDPMGTATGALVFAEHPAKNAEAFASLRHLSPYGRAALFPAHGEPWVFEGAVARAVAEARIV